MRALGDRRSLALITDSEENATKTPGLGVAVGIAIGLPLGAAAGILLLDSLATGAGIGLVVGLAIGAGFEASKNGKRAE
jgi:hypothetical protein